MANKEYQRGRKAWIETGNYGLLNSQSHDFVAGVKAAINQFPHGKVLIKVRTSEQMKAERGYINCPNCGWRGDVYEVIDDFLCLKCNTNLR